MRAVCGGRRMPGPGWLLLVLILPLISRCTAVNSPVQLPAPRSAPPTAPSRLPAKPPVRWGVQSPRAASKTTPQTTDLSHIRVGEDGWTSHPSVTEEVLFSTFQNLRRPAHRQEHWKRLRAGRVWSAAPRTSNVSKPPDWRHPVQCFHWALRVVDSHRLRRRRTAPLAENSPQEPTGTLEVKYRCKLSRNRSGRARSGRVSESALSAFIGIFCQHGYAQDVFVIGVNPRVIVKSGVWRSGRFPV